MNPRCLINGALTNKNGIITNDATMKIKDQYPGRPQANTNWSSTTAASNKLKNETATYTSLATKSTVERREFSEVILKGPLFKYMIIELTPTIKEMEALIGNIYLV